KVRVVDDSGSSMTQLPAKLAAQLGAVMDLALPDGQTGKLADILAEIKLGAASGITGVETYAELLTLTGSTAAGVMKEVTNDPGDVDGSINGVYLRDLDAPAGWRKTADRISSVRTIALDAQGKVNPLYAATQVLPNNGVKVLGKFEVAGGFFQLVTNHYWKWALIGTDRRVIIGKDKDNVEWLFGVPINNWRPAWLAELDDLVGAAVAAYEASLPPVYLDAGKVYEVGPTLILDPAPKHFLWRADRIGGMVRTIVDRAYLTAQTQVAVGKLLRIAMPCDPTVLHVILRIGQSTAVGALGFPLSAGLTVNPYPTKVLKCAGLDVRLGLQSNATVNPVFNPALITGFDPLVSMQGTDPQMGVTSCEAMGPAMVSAIGADTGFQPMILQLVVGRGGLGYADLKKGTVPYSNSIAALGAIRTVAQGLGWKVAMPLIVCNHGQANGNNPAYYGMQDEWQSDYSGDIQDLFDQAAIIPFADTMPSAFSEGYHHSGLAMAKLMEDFPDRFTVCCPEYHLSYDPDLTHPDAAGYMKRGRYEARAVIQQAYGTAGPWKPLWVPRTAFTWD
ncbi:MAG: hypothetical protein ACRC67_24205, partial [Inquilinus sp.]|uniref:hypothetical protein n=1 Tax=Inquilinus sp. TaxID=1932117 RepID=UPI003F2FD637